MSVFLNLFIIFSLFTVTKIPVVFACSCIPPGSPTEELAKSTAVFSGKVLNISRDGYADKVTFDVEKIWKGVSEKNVIVATATEGAMCGFGFRKNEKYIVYASGENPLSTNLCSRTRLLTLADTDISVLGIGKSPILRIEPTIQEPSDFSPRMITFGVVTALLILAGVTYKIIRSRKK